MCCRGVGGASAAGCSAARADRVVRPVGAGDCVEVAVDPAGRLARAELAAAQGAVQRVTAGGRVGPLEPSSGRAAHARTATLVAHTGPARPQRSPDQQATPRITTEVLPSASSTSTPIQRSAASSPRSSSLTRSPPTVTANLPSPLQCQWRLPSVGRPPLTVRTEFPHFSRSAARSSGLRREASRARRRASFLQSVSRLCPGTRGGSAGRAAPPAAEDRRGGPAAPRGRAQGTSRCCRLQPTAGAARSGAVLPSGALQQPASGAGPSAGCGASGANGHLLRCRNYSRVTARSPPAASDLRC
jgi:hypothetical protein